jgi:proton glutamate symport protein
MKNSILIKVLIAMALAVIMGAWTGPDKVLFGIPYLKIYSLVGQLFLNALHLVAIPLVSASIILGTARMGSESSVGILSAKTFGFYMLTSSLAVLIGLCGFFLLFFKAPIENLAYPLAIETNEVASLTVQSQSDTFDMVAQILLKLVPSNIFVVASQGQMLGLIFFSILFGFFLSKIEGDAASIVLGFLNGIFQIVMKMTHLVMKALPIGVFGLVAKVIAMTGLDSISSAALYCMTVIVSLIVYSLVIIPMLLIGVAGVNPILYFRAMSPALFTAFSTSSSAATLPVTIECIEKRVGVSNRICSFTVPLGTSLNMAGGALCMCIASLFIARTYAIPLSVTTISLVALMALLTSIGIAGIPSASLISVALILNTIGVPAEGIGLIIAVDRILDMFRTTVNVLGNATCAVLLARSEGEFNILTNTIS